MNPNARLERRWTAGVSTAVVIAILAGAAGANAQRDAPADKRPAFEVATVKLAAPEAVRNLVMPPPASPNRLHIPSMTLSTLIYSAYGDGGFNTSMRVTGGPDWINKTAFAVEGVASGRATPREFRLMLQTLLEERFALKLRTEMTTARHAHPGDGTERRHPRSEGQDVERHLSQGHASAVFPGATATPAERAALRRRMFQPWRNVPPVIERVGYHSMAPRCSQSQRSFRCRRRGRYWARSWPIKPA